MKEYSQLQELKRKIDKKNKKGNEKKKKEQRKRYKYVNNVSVREG